MKDNNIFIHIPKTGGTTLDCAIHGTQWIQNKNEFNYRHIVHETKMSNAGDIFKVQNFAKYGNYKLYMMLRHPVDKLVSEYYFVRDRKEYFQLFRKKPKNLVEYAQNPQARNSTINFLLGKRFYPNSLATEADLERIKQTIDQLPIYVGIFEEFEKSLEYFRNKLEFKIPKKIDVKRITLNRPTIDNIDETTRKIILQNNKLDHELYIYCKEKFDQAKIKNKTYKISKDRYSYIMKYSERFSLFQLYIPKSKFLIDNQNYLRDINFLLHQRVSFTEGKKYTTLFNRIVVHDIIKKFPQLEEELKQISKHENLNDPLEDTEKLSKLLTKFGHTSKLFTKARFKFDLSNYPQALLQLKEEKKSLFSRLFGRK